MAEINVNIEEILPYKEVEGWTAEKILKNYWNSSKYSGEIDLSKHWKAGKLAWNEDLEYAKIPDHTSDISVLINGNQLLFTSAKLDNNVNEWYIHEDIVDYVFPPNSSEFYAGNIISATNSPITVNYNETAAFAKNIATYTTSGDGSDSRIYTDEVLSNFKLKYDAEDAIQVPGKLLYNTSYIDEYSTDIKRIFYSPGEDTRFISFEMKNDSNHISSNIPNFKNKANDTQIYSAILVQVFKFSIISQGTEPIYNITDPMTSGESISCNAYSLSPKYISSPNGYIILRYRWDQSPWDISPATSVPTIYFEGESGYSQGSELPYNEQTNYQFGAKQDGTWYDASLRYRLTSIFDSKSTENDGIRNISVIPDSYITNTPEGKTSSLFSGDFTKNDKSESRNLGTIDASGQYYLPDDGIYGERSFNINKLRQTSFSLNQAAPGKSITFNPTSATKEWNGFVYNYTQERHFSTTIDSSVYVKSIYLSESSTGSSENLTLIKFDSPTSTSTNIPSYYSEIKVSYKKNNGGSWNSFNRISNGPLYAKIAGDVNDNYDISINTFLSSDAFYNANYQYVVIELMAIPADGESSPSSTFKLVLSDPKYTLSLANPSGSSEWTINNLNATYNGSVEGGNTGNIILSSSFKYKFTNIPSNCHIYLGSDKIIQGNEYGPSANSKLYINYPSTSTKEAIHLPFENISNNFKASGELIINYEGSVGISLEPDNISFSSSGGNGSFTLKSSGDWKLTTTEPSGFFDISPYPTIGSATTGTEISFTVSENKSPTTSRNATLKAYLGNETSTTYATATITQSSTAPEKTFEIYIEGSKTSSGATIQVPLSATTYGTSCYVKNTGNIADSYTGSISPTTASFSFTGGGSSSGPVDPNDKANFVISIPENKTTVEKQYILTIQSTNSSQTVYFLQVSGEKGFKIIPKTTSTDINPGGGSYVFNIQNVGTISSSYEISSTDSLFVPSSTTTGTLSPKGISEDISINVSKNETTSSRSAQVLIADSGNSSINNRINLILLGWDDPKIEIDPKYYSSGSWQQLVNGTVLKQQDVSCDISLLDKHYDIDVSDVDYTISVSEPDYVSIKWNSGSAFRLINSVNLTQENIPVLVTVGSYYKSIKGSYTESAPYIKTFNYNLGSEALVSIGGEYDGLYLRDHGGKPSYIFGPGYGLPGYGVRTTTIYDANGGKCNWSISENSPNSGLSAHITPSVNVNSGTLYITCGDDYTGGSDKSFKITAKNTVSGNDASTWIYTYRYPAPSFKLINSKDNEVSECILSASDFKEASTYKDYYEYVFFINYNASEVEYNYEVMGDDGVSITQDSSKFTLSIYKNTSTTRDRITNIKFKYNYNDSIPDHTDDLIANFTVKVNKAPQPTFSIDGSSSVACDFAMDNDASVPITVNMDNYLPVQCQYILSESGTTGNEFDLIEDAVASKQDSKKYYLSVPINPLKSNKKCSIKYIYNYIGSDETFEAVKVVTVEKSPALDISLNYRYNSGKDITVKDDRIIIGCNYGLDDSSVSIDVSIKNSTKLPTTWMFKDEETGTSGNEFNVAKVSDNSLNISIPINASINSTKTCSITITYYYTDTIVESYYINKLVTLTVNPAAPIQFKPEVLTLPKEEPETGNYEIDHLPYYYGIIKKNDASVTFKINIDASLPVSWTYYDEESGTQGNEFIFTKSDISTLVATIPTNPSLVINKTCLLTFTYYYTSTENHAQDGTLTYKLNVDPAVQPKISIDPSTYTWQGIRTSGSDKIDVSIKDLDKWHLPVTWEYNAIETGTSGAEFKLLKNNDSLSITAPTNSSLESPKNCNITFKCYYSSSIDHVNDYSVMGLYSVNSIKAPILSFTDSGIDDASYTWSDVFSEDSSEYSKTLYGIYDATGVYKIPNQIRLSSDYITYNSEIIGKFLNGPIISSSSRTQKGNNVFNVNFEMYDNTFDVSVYDIISITPVDDDGHEGRSCEYTIMQSPKKDYKPIISTASMAVSANTSDSYYNVGFSQYVPDNSTYSPSYNDTSVLYDSSKSIIDDFGLSIRDKESKVWTTLWNKSYHDKLIYSADPSTIEDDKKLLKYTVSLPYTNNVFKIYPGKIYEYKSVIKTQYRDGKQDPSAWANTIVEGNTRWFKINDYKESDLEYIRPYFKPAEKVSGYKTGTEIKSFLNSKGIVMNRRKNKTIDISNWYNNYSISNGILTLNINDAIIDTIMNNAAFNKAWSYISDAELVNAKKLYIKNIIIPNISINNKSVVDIYYDDESSSVGLTSTYKLNMVKETNIGNKMKYIDGNNSYQMQIKLNHNKKYYVVLHLVY